MHYGGGGGGGGIGRYRGENSFAVRGLLKPEGARPMNRSAWAGFTKKCRRMWPFIWPSNNHLLQLRVLACLIILVAARVINVLIPVLQKKIVNSLSQASTALIKTTNTSSGMFHSFYTASPDMVTTVYSDLATLQTTYVFGEDDRQALAVIRKFRWDFIVYIILLKTMQGESGYLTILRSFLWIRVSQDTRKKMRVRLFAHLHNLSLRWHLQRKTGEVLRVMDRGVNSINSVLSQALFNMLPVIADITIAVVFFIAVFNIWTGLVILAAMVGYGGSTVLLSEWRTKYRRTMNEASNQQDQASVDSILNFETVKYHAAEEFEVERYAKAVEKHLEAEWTVSASLSLLNIIQKTMMSFGLLGGSLICAWMVYDGQLTVGDYVLFISYVEQLYMPLNMLGMYYRMMQQSFIDMENMFDMLDEKQEVIDKPDASALQVTKGEIVFDDVSFNYGPDKPLMEGLSFVVPAGQTYALVGPSGGGKSSILKLLLRFYDVKSGTIMIDGQDIANVTQKSLREQIGVVPQDTVLFNENIGYNIRYGNTKASQEEVEMAACSADIEKFILSLTEGYQTMVGERGLKLSGGEKQRIAIARTVLKAPQIVLLDEATSALDTHTERNIQSALMRMCANRTTIVVAHRLSTIIAADQILVIRDGKIVERGRHEELIAREEIYAKMWQEQLRSASAIDNEKEDVKRLSALHETRLDVDDEADDETPLLNDPDLDLPGMAGDECFAEDQLRKIEARADNRSLHRNGSVHHDGILRHDGTGDNRKSCDGDVSKFHLAHPIDSFKRLFLSMPCDLDNYK